MTPHPEVETIVQEWVADTFADTDISVREPARAKLIQSLTSLISRIEEAERNRGVTDGYRLAVKHLREAFQHNAFTTLPEAIEWLEDNARLTHSTENTL